MAKNPTKRKNLTQILSLIVAVSIVVVASILFQTWWKNRPGQEPAEVTISAYPNDTKDQAIEVHPYSICEPGVPCDQGEVPSLALGEEDSLTLELPKDIYDHDWSLLSIYDDPAANDETYFGANEQQEVTIPGSVPALGDDSEQKPRLVVVEVSSVLIGHDQSGEESPYTVTWSISTDYAKQADTSGK